MGKSSTLGKKKKLKAETPVQVKPFISMTKSFIYQKFLMYTWYIRKSEKKLMYFWYIRWSETDVFLMVLDILWQG